jgi:hypothetical protein
MTNLTRRVMTAAVPLTLALAPTSALAAWESTAAGTGTVQATHVEKAATPEVTLDGATVRIAWAASTMGNGAPVGGYDVYRYVGTSRTFVCSAGDPERTCTDPRPSTAVADYVVVARVGTSWTGPESDRARFSQDSAAPSTTWAQNPEPNGHGWNRSNVSVTLSATDTGLGVASISYRIGSGEVTTVVGASAGFQLTTEGTHEVEYWSTDNAGNVEDHHTRTVRIDKQAPGVPTITGISVDTGTSSTDRVTKVAGQSMTGTAEPGSTVTVRRDGTVLGSVVADSSGRFAVDATLVEGANSLTATAADPAGNESGASPALGATLDTVAPSLPTDLTYPVGGGTKATQWNSDKNRCGSPLAPGVGAPGVCGTVDGTGTMVTAVGYELRFVTTPGVCWDGAALTPGSCGTWRGTTLLQGPAVNAARWGIAIPREAVNLGDYEVRLRIEDLAGNLSVSSEVPGGSATYTFDVDR